MITTVVLANSSITQATFKLLHEDNLRCLTQSDSPAETPGSVGKKRTGQLSMLSPLPSKVLLSL